MDDGALGTDAVEGVPTEGLPAGFVFIIDREAVGELGAVSVRRCASGAGSGREGAPGRQGGGAAAIAEDFGIGKAGGAIDRDIGVAGLTARRRQVFGVSMDEAGGVSV